MKRTSAGPFDDTFPRSKSSHFPAPQVDRLRSQVPLFSGVKWTSQTRAPVSAFDP